MANSLETYISPSHVTIFTQVNLSLTLTDEGLQNFTQVLAIISHYLKLVKNEWLSGEMPTLFTETQTVNKLNYDLYKVPE